MFNLLPAVPMHVDPANNLGVMGTGNECDSWFFCGQLKSAETGEIFDYLIHQKRAEIAAAGLKMCDRQITITNMTHPSFVCNHQMFPFEMMHATHEAFDIRTPGTVMSGTLEKMYCKTETPVGAMELNFVPSGPVMTYLGGRFPFFDILVNQYALPRLETVGTMTVDGKTHHVTGQSWFDRQWQQSESAVMSGNHWKWTWFSLHFDNHEDVMSIWDLEDLSNGKSTHFVVVQDKQGSTTIAEMLPLAPNEGDIWESEASGRRYPNSWKIEIPSLNACLYAKTTLPGQEILFSPLVEMGPEVCRNPQSGTQHNAQAAFTLEGIYKGQEVTGLGHMELVGGW